MFDMKEIKRHEIETAILVPGWHFVSGRFGAEAAEELRKAGKVDVDPYSNRPGVYVRAPEKQSS
jgi:hypothetical protein